MSFLTKTAFRPLACLNASRAIVVTERRAFHLSGVRAALSESDRHHDDDAETHKEEIEKHKQDSLQQKKDGKAGWKKELASNSESAIKADRGEIEATEDEIANMQKATKAYQNSQRSEEK